MLIDSVRSARVSCTRQRCMKSIFEPYRRVAERRVAGTREAELPLMELCIAQERQIRICRERFARFRIWAIKVEAPLPRSVRGR